jgi:hypothetical protein
MKVQFLSLLIVSIVLTGCKEVQARGFKLVYRPTENAQEQKVRDMLEGSGRVREVVRGLNKALKPPKRVSVEFGGKVVPLYNPNTRTVEIPYAFVGALLDSFANLGGSEPTQRALDVTEFILYHEVSHALIDLLELPVHGDVEECADQLAVLLSVELVGEGGRIGLAAAQLLAIQSQAGTASSSFGYSISSDRIKQTICWVVGSDPGRLMWIAEETNIRPSQTESCPREFEEMRDHWLKLLRPYLRG